MVLDSVSMVHVSMARLPCAGPATVLIMGKSAGVVWFAPQRLRDARTARGLSQAQLGHVLNASGDLISDWERGRTRPDVRSLTRLATGLDRRVSDLLTPDAPRSLEVLRICAGFTQSALASALRERMIRAEMPAKMSREMWARIERGERTLPPPLRGHLAEVLRVNVAEIAEAESGTASKVGVAIVLPEEVVAVEIEAYQQPGETLADTVIRRLRQLPF